MGKLQQHGYKITKLNISYGKGCFKVNLSFVCSGDDYLTARFDNLASEYELIGHTYNIEEYEKYTNKDYVLSEDERNEISNWWDLLPDSDWKKELGLEDHYKNSKDSLLNIRANKSQYRRKISQVLYKEGDTYHFTECVIALPATIQALNDLQRLKRYKINPRIDPAYELSLIIETLDKYWD